MFVAELAVWFAVLARMDVVKQHSWGAVFALCFGIVQVGPRSTLSAPVCSLHAQLSSIVVAFGYQRSLPSPDAIPLDATPYARLQHPTKF